MAAQVTGLTSLMVYESTASADDQLAMIAAHNTQLQKLVIAASHSEGLGAAHLQHLLTSCPGLTELVLRSRNIDQDGLDALPAHGTRITHLTLSSSSLTASRAHVPCTWKVLNLRHPSLQQLAYLPLRSVQELPAGLGTPGDELELRFDSETPAPQLLSLLSQAASNLTACPACTKQPQHFTGLQLAGSPPVPAVQLFEALAPLRVMQLEQLDIRRIGQELGSPEVEALAHSLGDSIKSLKFEGFTLQSSFWRALVQYYPNLRQLTLGVGVQTSIADLSSFLGMRSQNGPGSLTMRISWGALNDTGFAELKAHIAATQLQDVRLLRH
jgi:hypothetical protein